MEQKAWFASGGIHSRQRIAESRLLDIHPIYGGTRGTFSEQSDWPGLESGLFALAEVLHIEAEDFGDAHALTEPFTANPELMSYEVTAKEIPISSPLISITARKTTANGVHASPKHLKAFGLAKGVPEVYEGKPRKVGCLARKSHCKIGCRTGCQPGHHQKKT